MYFQKELFFRPFLQSTIARQPSKVVESIFWIKWSGCILFLLILFVFTLQVAPFLHMDEVLTVELGRTILHSRTDWSITWMTDRNEPAFVFFYIGPLLQEVMYQILGQYGPRIFALFSAMMAATVMVKYLLLHSISKNNAFILGLVFLLDPLFVQAYTLGRIDGLSICFALSACCFLRAAANNSIANHAVNLNVLLSGTLITLALFTWPSAFFLFPLVLMEWINLVKKKNVVSSLHKTSVLKYAGLFTIASIVTTMLMLLPVLSQFYSSIGNMIEGLKINTTTGPEVGVGSGLIIKFSSLVEFIRVLKFTPFVFLIAIFSFIRKPNVNLLLALLAAFVLIFTTIVYIHRVLYLLPYLLLSIAFFIEKLRLHYFRLFNLSVQSVMLFVLIVWCVGLSVVSKTYLGWLELITGRREAIENAAHKMVGKANERVLLLDTYEFYYYGRSMGWKMFSPYASMGKPLSSLPLQKMLQNVNVVIIKQWQLSPALANQLKGEKFTNRSTYQLYPQSSNKAQNNVTTENRLRSLYRIVKQPYGPYFIFKRTQ